ncbi:MAG: molybdopterin-synthase adenylyltransferase MoeB [Myxococcales bacterium]|nr:molybdopterin-synthase adenylyltransferase MoeB [Myxococcota bacterium]MDW8281498.1 molybdopterin-synthase adenylyltransferase MoeB [Myxococcales bacterium]
MASFQSYLQQIKSSIVETTVQQVHAERPAVLIDVREKDEYQEGYIPGALWIPRGRLEMNIEEAVPDRDADVVVYCAGGSRSALAARTLGELGYRRVRSMAGGFSAWRRAGFPIEKPFVFTEEQRSRYARHIMLPEVGEAGQARLLRARVLLVGAGGLGSPAGLYLGAAGVGTLGIVDDDVVDASNLQRQVLHNTTRLGMPKVESAERTLTELNPDVRVVRHPVRLVSDNVLDIIRDYDVIVDGADNFQTRYLINDASLAVRKPVVHASVFRFEGQITTFVPYQGPCYRCLYPEPPSAGMAPSCNEAGVLGVLPGVMGVLQATETIKLLLGIGQTLVGRLLLYDALRASIRELRLRRDPGCVVCADPNKPIKLIDYEAFCART